MKIVSIQEARRFSLAGVQRNDLLEVGGLNAELLCFEAGQAAEPDSGGASVVYQVLEGEALVRSGGTTQRLGKGKLLGIDAGAEHSVENAGGGLLVVLAVRAS